MLLPSAILAVEADTADACSAVARSQLENTRKLHASMSADSDSEACIRSSFLSPLATAKIATLDSLTRRLAWRNLMSLEDPLRCMDGVGR